ncbi:MAG: flippase [Acidobacteriota bacterium]
MSPPLWKKGLILKNSAAILGSRVIIPLAFFIQSLVVARLLGPDGLGHFAAVMSFYLIFFLLSGMGLENLLLRDVAREPQKAGEYFSHALLLGVVSSLGCALLMLATADLLGYSPEIRYYLLWMTLVLLPGFVNLIAELLFIALHKAGHAFLLALLREALMLVLSVYWLLEGWGLRGVIIALIVSRVFGAVLSVAMILRLGIRFSTRLQPAFFRRFVKLIPPFLLINLLSNLLMEVDIIILSRLLPASEVGFYMVAKKLVRAGFLVFFSVVTALFPDITQAFERSDPRFGQLFRDLGWKVFWGSSALAAVTFLFSDLGIRLTYGPEYGPSVALMQAFAWLLIPLSLSFLLSRFLIIGNQQNKDLLALVIAVLTLMGSGIACTLQWGTAGMVGALLFSVSLLCLLHFGFAKFYLFRPYAARIESQAAQAEAGSGSDLESSGLGASDLEPVPQPAPAGEPSP